MRRHAFVFLTLRIGGGPAAAPPLVFYSVSSDLGGSTEGMCYRDRTNHYWPMPLSRRERYVQDDTGLGS